MCNVCCIGRDRAISHTMIYLELRIRVFGFSKISGTKKLVTRLRYHHVGVRVLLGELFKLFRITG